MTRPPPNILLIGPRACGKTSIGRRIATTRGLPFVDLDDVVLRGFPEATIREVWATHGEAAWRAGEVAALADTLADPGQVVALGGGTPVIVEARRRIESEKKAGRAAVLYLRCTVDELVSRLGAGPRAGPGDRPSLTGDDVAAEVESVLANREPVYTALADIVIEPGGGGLSEVVDQVMAWLRRLAG